MAVFNMIEEADATGKVKEVFEDIKKKREEIEKIKIEYDINDNDPTGHNNELIHNKNDNG